ncbi:MAG: hypothetical protein ACNA8W_04075, partial [Bradymonadaceae bacterium]
MMRKFEERAFALVISLAPGSEPGPGPGPKPRPPAGSKSYDVSSAAALDAAVVELRKLLNGDGGARLRLFCYDDSLYHQTLALRGAGCRRPASCMNMGRVGESPGATAACRRWPAGPHLDLRQDVRS